MANEDSGRAEEGDKQSESSAFVLFRPQNEVSKEELLYNEAALRILTFPLYPSKITPGRRLDISALCSRWVKSLEKRRTEHESGESMSP